MPPTKQITPYDTSYFNPEVDNRAPQDFTRDSRGIDVAPAQRYAEGDTSMLLGLGNVWEMIVNGTDQVIKKDIENKATDAYDQAINAQIGLAAPPAGVKDSTAPNDLVKRGERLKGLQTAKQAGRITDSHYWALLDMETRKLRDRYPGHRAYIDDMMQGLTGRAPANALKDALDREAASTGEKFTEEQKFINYNLEYLSPATRAKYDSGQASFAFARDEIHRNQRDKSLIALEESKLKLKESRTQDDVTKAKQTLSRRIAFQFKNMDDGMDFDSFQKNLNSVIDKKLSGPEMEQLIIRTNQWATNMRTQIASVGLGQGSDDVNYSELGLTGKDFDDVQKPYFDLVDMVVDGVTNNKVGMLYRAKAQLEFMKDDIQADMLKNPAIRTLTGLTSLLGDKFLDSQVLEDAMKGDGKLLSALPTAIRDQLLFSIASGEKTLSEAYDQAKASGKDSPALYRSVIDIPLAALEEPTVPAKTVSTIIRQMFAGDGGDFLKKIDGTAKGAKGEYKIPETFKAYKQITKKPVLDSLEKIRESDPEAYATAQNWIHTGANALGAQVIADARNINLTPQEIGVDLAWDPRLKQFRLNSEFMRDRREQKPIFERTVARLNDVMRPVIIMAENAGADPEEAVTEALGAMGLNLNETPPENTFLGTILKGAGNLVQKAATNLKEGYKDRPNLFGRSNLGGPTGRQANTEGGGEYPDILPRARLTAMDKTGKTMTTYADNETGNSDPVSGLRQELGEALKLFKANPTPETQRYLKMIFEMATEAKKIQDEMMPTMVPTSGDFSDMKEGK